MLKKKCIRTKNTLNNNVIALTSIQVPSGTCTPQPREIEVDFASKNTHKGPTMAVPSLKQVIESNLVLSNQFSIDELMATDILSPSTSDIITPPDDVDDLDDEKHDFRTTISYSDQTSTKF